MITDNEIEKLRDYYQLPDYVTDECIRRECKDSLGLQAIRLNVATQSLKQALIDAMPRIIKKYF